VQWHVLGQRFASLQTSCLTRRLRHRARIASEPIERNEGAHIHEYPKVAVGEIRRGQVGSGYATSATRRRNHFFTGPTVPPGIYMESNITWRWSARPFATPFTQRAILVMYCSRGAAK
jgi:hypothetical protein